MTAPIQTPVLLVDDRPENIRALMALLEDLGFDLVQALSGNEALRLTLRTEFALVLLDVQMPDMDGFETAELLRANPKTRNLPIIFVTAGMKDKAFRFKGYDAGAVDYLTKPFDPMELRSKVRVFCDLFIKRKELEAQARLLETLVDQRTLAMRESEASYRAILESASDWVMRYDRRGAHLFTNGVALARMKCTLDQALGRTQRELGLPGNFCDLCEPAIEKVFATGQPETVSCNITFPEDSVYLELKLSPENDLSGRVRSVVGMARDLTEHHRLEEVRHFLAQANWQAQDGSFFHSLARYLVSWLNMGYVCIDRLEGDAKTAHTLAIFSDGRFEPNVSYSLQDTPCAEVVGKGVCCIPQGVRTRFPKDGALQDMEAESYVGTILRDSGGIAIGLIAVIGRRPLANPGLAEKILEMVAIRAAGELERKVIEDALLARGAEFRSFVESAPDGIFVTDRDRRYLMVNPAYCLMTGFTPDEFLRMNIGDLLPEEDREMGRMLHDQLKEKGRVSGEIQLRRKDGSTFWAFLDAVKISEDRLLAFCKDITERKEAEEERRKIEERMGQVQKLEALGTLAAGVAHNINNVLAAIMALASSRKNSATDMTDMEAYETIVKTCSRGRDVVKSLTHFAKPTLNNPAPIEIHALIREVCDLLESTTRNRIKIMKSLAVEPLWVHGDIGSLNHALMNLCINAMDAMPDGGTLTFRTGLPRLDWVEVSIEDDGEGMLPDILARAIEPFFTTKEVGKGTGLGLSMTRGVVKAHGGNLEISSVPGQGTTVKILLPRIYTPAVIPTSKAPSPSLGSLNVLLVDDDEDVRFLVARMLQNAGHKVKSVAGGEEALESLSRDPIPDFIILDQNMPRMDGFQTMENIRRIHLEVPILISSGQPDIEGWDCFKQPNVIVISKPFALEEIEAKLALFSTIAREKGPYR